MINLKFTLTNNLFIFLAAMINRFRSFMLAAILLFAATNSYAQFSVTATLGTTGPTSYTSLTLSGGVFTAINAGTHKGVITVSVTANSTSETGVTALNASGSGSASYTSITISPSGGAARTISGTSTTVLISLSGASNVKINGLNTGGNSLIIANLSNGNSASTIKMLNDAKNDTLENCTIQGSSTTYNSNGTIWLAGGASTGNTGIVIQNDTIASSSGGLPQTAIFSQGTSTTDYNTATIQNNIIRDYFNPTGYSNGIYLATYNGSWTISGNSFYQSATRTSTSTSNDHAIYLTVTSGPANAAYTILNNIIGYGTASQTGTTTYAGSNANTFAGIESNIQSTDTANINGNTIAGINLTSTQNNTGINPQTFTGIVIDAGVANIGKTSGNIIGTSTASITVSCSASGWDLAGIYIGPASNSTTAYTVSNNIIQNINTGTSANSITFNGIWLSTFNGTSAAAGTITNNNIGNGLTNSIQIGLSGVPTVGSSVVNGIQFNTNGACVITGNHIDTISTYAGASTFTGILITGTAATPSISNNIINLLTIQGSSSGSSIIGIYYSGGTTSSQTTDTISGNTIANLTSPANFTNAMPNAVSGIAFNPSNNSDNEGILSKNIIYNLSNTYNSTSGLTVYGIFLGGSGNGNPATVSQNLIYSLYANNANTSATIAGLTFSSSMSATVVNNIIQLGYANGPSITGAMAIYGIYETNPNQVMNYYYNTVYIGGSGVGTALNNTFAFFGGGYLTNTSTHENNIFVNVRSNSSSINGGSHYAIELNNQGGENSVFISNYNDYYVSGTGTVFGRYGVQTPNNNVTSLSSWITTQHSNCSACKSDSQSISSNPLFVNPTGTPPDVHLQSGTPVHVSGAPALASITTVDYYGNLRASYSPVDLGAVIADGISAPTSFTAVAASATQINLTAASSNNIVVVWSLSALTGSPTQGIAPTSTGTTLAGTSGTILYSGPTAGFNHTGLTRNTTYFYEAFSYDAINNYSAGLLAQAKTMSITGTSTPSTICAGAPVSVTFTPNAGTGGAFISGNVYTAQLSDATGSFSSPTTIGTITSNSSGSLITINANPGIIPANATTSSLYKIRITSSNPSIISDSSSAFTINALPAVAAIGGGAATVCVNAATPGFTDGTSSGTWSITAGTGTASITSGGVVTGLTAGTVTVVYTFSNGTCTNTATTSLTVNALPTVAAIGGGASTVCVNATTVAFTDATGSGTWSITPGTGTASITTGGVVTGLTAGTVTVVFTYSNGTCTNTATTPLTVNNCIMTLNTTFFIQGYYLGGSKMSPLLHLLGGASGTAVDTVTIQLFNTSNKVVAADSYTGVLQMNGTLACSFAQITSGNYYYIVINHRNSLKTWSKDSVQMSLGNTYSYDFTTAANKAFGSNMANLGGGVYGIYSGDINRDGSINGSDKFFLQSALSSFIVGAYNINDVTGDGFVDEDDYRILENNTSLNVSVLHP